MFGNIETKLINGDQNKGKVLGGDNIVNLVNSSITSLVDIDMFGIGFSLRDSIDDFSKKVEEFSYLICLDDIKNIQDFDLLIGLIDKMLEYIIAKKDLIIDNPYSIKINFRSILDFIKNMSSDESFKNKLVGRLSNNDYDILEKKLYDIDKKMILGYYCFVPIESENKKLPENLKTTEMIDFLRTLNFKKSGEKKVQSTYEDIRVLCKSILYGDEFKKLDEYQLSELGLNLDLLIREIEKNILKFPDINRGLNILIEGKKPPLKKALNRTKSELFKKQFSIPTYINNVKKLKNYNQNELIKNPDIFSKFLNGFRNISLDLIYCDDFRVLEKEVLDELKECLKFTFERLEKVNKNTTDNRILYNSDRYLKSKLGLLIMN